MPGGGDLSLSSLWLLLLLLLCFLRIRWMGITHKVLLVLAVKLPTIQMSSQGSRHWNPGLRLKAHKSLIFTATTCVTSS